VPSYSRVIRKVRTGGSVKRPPGCGSHLPLTARGNPERLAILRHRPASDLEALRLELLGDGLVGEGILLVLGVDDLLHPLLHGHRGLHPRGPFRRPREELLEGEDAPVRLDPLVRDGATDRGDVDAEVVGDLLHLERLQVLRSVIEELPLVVDDPPAHLVERVAPLLDRVDEPARGLDLPLDVLPHRGVALVRLQQAEVAGTHAEARVVVVLETDLVLAVHVLQDDVGLDVHGRLGAGLAPGMARDLGPKLADQLVELRERDAQLAGDARTPVLRQVVEVVAEKPALQRVALLFRVELEQQALLDAPGADPGRLEALHDGESRLGLLHRVFLLERAEDLLERVHQAPVPVEVEDDLLREHEETGLGRHVHQLGDEIVLEAHRPRGRVLHRLQLAVLLPVVAPTGPRGTLPLEAALDQLLQAAHGLRERSLLVRGGSIRLRVAVAGGLLEIDLEGLVLGELLLDHVPQVHGGKLEDLDRLDDLRRELELELELLLKRGLEPHGVRRRRSLSRFIRM
jgi:hypothetical protein